MNKMSSDVINRTIPNEVLSALKLLTKELKIDQEFNLVREFWVSDLYYTKSMMKVAVYDEKLKINKIVYLLSISMFHVLIEETQSLEECNLVINSLNVINGIPVFKGHLPLHYRYINVMKKEEK